MNEMEYRILKKRQELRDILNYSLTESPVYLPLIKQIKAEIDLCNLVLERIFKGPVYKSS